MKKKLRIQPGFTSSRGSFFLSWNISILICFQMFQQRPVSFLRASLARQSRLLKQRIRWHILGLQAAKRHIHQ